ncbi:antibiotic biosynthesis monooxygenase [Pedococcus sp. NPDC057267]|uniref:antibiotic biosynthesis monooxygenase n=1 Tax=Pedococcus sp. NPDC057267 TaxID=3346077 RepID=UPI003642D7B0
MTTPSPSDDPARATNGATNSLAPSAGPLTSAPDGAVTVAITRRVRPEDSALMQAWVDAGTSLARRFPGFLGTGWVRPSGASEDWHMLYRFDSRASLLLWEESRERTQWLRSGKGLVEHTRVEHRTGIEGWFDEPSSRTAVDLSGDGRDSTAPPAPPRWKQAVTIWVAFFPTNLLFTWLLTPFTHLWALPLRVLFMTVLLTPVMTYLVLPQVTRLLQPWLARVRSR